jgi:hypothetical protein
VAYSDSVNSKKATLMKFDGTNWTSVGNVGFSAGGALYTSVAFSPAGEPYVAYVDNGNSGKTTVLRYHGTNWLIVGQAGFSAGQAAYLSLAFNPSDGHPYLAFQDWQRSFKATVMNYSAVSWLNVGSAGFSKGKADYTSLAFSPSGEPNVGFVDHANSEKATVMKFDSVYVGVGEKEKITFTIYPNPATDKITIETNLSAQCSVLNAVGREFIHQELTQTKSVIDVSTLPSGIYMVKLTSVKEVRVGKFIRQ